MLRLTKYLRPYLLPILFTIVLLFIQANSELALPDYLSRIVNYGIQQGGVENAVPQAIRQSQMEKLFLFLGTDEKAIVKGDYTLLTTESSDYERYVAEYPALAEEPVYVLNAIDRAEIGRLNPIMGKGLVVVYGIEQMVENPDNIPAIMGNVHVALSLLPEGMDIFTVLGAMPASQMEQITVGMDEKFAVLGESMINQVAAVAIKSEYEALGMDMGKLQTQYILRTGGIMLLLSLLTAVCTILVGLLSARTAAGTARDLRSAIFKKVESFTSAEFNKCSPASLITRSTNDITQLQMVIVMIMRMVFFAPIMGVGSVIRAIGKSASMWWILALGVVTLMIIIIVLFSVALPKFKIVTRESLSGMMVIRSFNKQRYEEERFDKANKDLTSTTLFISRLMVVMMPVMMLIMNGLSLLIIWVGAHQVADANMQVGDMMAFLQYAMHVVFSFLMMSLMFITIPRASVSAERIAEILETELLIKDPEKPQSFNEPFKPTVEFRNVCFRYPDAQEDVLHDITFTAHAGETTAIIGSTGSGKSTVVNLIPRFQEVSEGAVYVNGVDVRAVTQHDLREKIGYIPQRGLLFSGTIESNLRYGDENASSHVLEEAIEIAQAKEFIDEKPERLEAEISQGGTNVSGGQKQRLSIARALVKKSPIYIFDDSFSALDFKTDSALRRALKQKTGGSTVLIVTQRISTIKNADQIIVLDDGKIVGKGKHQELMKTCQTYQEIALSQLSKEELA